MAILYTWSFRSEIIAEISRTIHARSVSIGYYEHSAGENRDRFVTMTLLRHLPFHLDREIARLLRRGDVIFFYSYRYATEESLRD